MADEAKQPAVHVEPQPSADAQSHMEWLVRSTAIATEATRREDAEREAERAAATERSEKVPTAKPAPTKQPPAPKPSEPAGAALPKAPDSSAEARALARKLRALEARDAEHAQRWREIEKIAPKARMGLAALEAFEAGDIDEFAKAFGRKEWGEIQEHFVQSYSDPGYRRARDLERKLAEIKERERQQAEQAQAQAAELQRQQARAVYARQIVDEMKGSTDPVLAEFHDDPGLVDALLHVRGEEWQRTGRELPLSKCLDVKRANGRSIREELEAGVGYVERYRNAANKGRANAPAPKVHASPGRATPAAKSRAAEPRYGWQASSAKDSDEAWLTKGKKLFGAAVAEERKREKYT